MKQEWLGRERIRMEGRAPARPLRQRKSGGGKARPTTKRRVSPTGKWTCPASWHGGPRRRAGAFAEGTFTFEREAPYHVDGEVRKAARELRVTLEPKALEVCVPPRYRA